MALETCCEGCSRDTWGSGSRLAIKSPGLGYLIHDARLPISSLIPALRLCSTAIARAGSCSLITFSKPDGRKPFFFSYLLFGLPLWLSGKESTYNMGDLGSIPELERSPGEGKGYPLPDSGLENSTDCIVYRVTKSQT